MLNNLSRYLSIALLTLSSCSQQIKKIDAPIDENRRLEINLKSLEDYIVGYNLRGIISDSSRYFYFQCLIGINYEGSLDAQRSLYMKLRTWVLTDKFMYDRVKKEETERADKGFGSSDKKVA